MAITVRHCLNDDIPGLMEMFKTVYPFNPRMQEADYFDWQYRQSPVGQSDEYTFLLAVDNSEICGFLGYVPVDVVYNGDVLKGCWTQHWFSKPGEQGALMLFYTVMDKFDYRFHIGFSRESLAIFKASRIPMINAVPRMIGILSVDGVADRFNIAHNSDLERFRQSRKSLRSLNGGASIQPCSRFPDGFEYHYQKWPDTVGYCRRNDTYLNWRYVDIPRHDYQILLGDEGFCVYRIERIKGDDRQVMRILDWGFNDQAASAALAYLVDVGMAHGCILMDYFGTHTGISAQLKTFGLIDSSRLLSEIPYLFRPICQADGIRLALDFPPHRKKRSVDFSQWVFSKGDCDIDRFKL